MRLASFLPILAVSACTSDPPVDYVIGAFERHDEQGRVIDRLVFDDAGQFKSTCGHYPPIDDVFLLASGTYGWEGRRMWFHGTARDGHTFELETSFFADATEFSLAPYVPYEGTEHRHAVYNLTMSGASWSIEPELYMDSLGYVIAYVDPIWGDQETESGDVAEQGSDTLVFDGRDRFRKLDNGAVLARDEPDLRCLDYEPEPMPYDMGMLYERVQ